MWALVAWGALAVAGTLLLGRWLGPGDLYEKDQPHTVAYTADMVLHGGWGELALPRDELQQRATKPPLYNWLAVPGVAAFGFGAWPLKLPTMLAAAGTVGLTFWLTRRVTGDPLLAGLAAALWLANPVGLRLAYLARPDMLQAFGLTAAAGVVMLAGPWWLFWAAVAGIGLTKGPAAVLPVLFALVYRPRWLLTWRQGVGAALAVAAIGLWLLAAWRVDPRHVRTVLLGAEVVQRIADVSPDGQKNPPWMIAAWFGTKFLPWSLLALVGGFAAWRGGGAGLRPFAVWLGVVLVGLSVPAGKRVDYLLPAMIAAGPLAAWAVLWAVRRVGLPRPAALVPLVLVAGYVLHHNAYRSGEARHGWTDRLLAFADDVRPVVRGRPTLVLVRGKVPLATLLGRHHGAGPTEAELASAAFVVTERIDDRPALATSTPLPVGFGAAAGQPTARLALYRRADMTDDEVRAARGDMMDWTLEDNPYRHPGMP